MKTRIIVCGGRNFSDKEAFGKYLDVILPRYENIELVSGHAKGADSFTEEYAAEKGIPVAVFKPDWKKYGRAAGPIRNKEMLEYAMAEKPVVIAFWDGVSRGTKNMIMQAKAAGCACHIVRYSEKRCELAEERKREIEEMAAMLL